MERRRAAHADRLKLAEDRWRRFQAANARAVAGKDRWRATGRAATLLAGAKSAGRLALLRLSGLWDETIDVSLGSMPGPTLRLEDYVRAGPDPTAQPRALFDQSWYLERAANLAGSRWALLAHYLVVGDAHNLSPHPLLDAPAYRSRHGAAMRARRMTALEHFVFQGAAEGADPHPLFDVRYYVGQSEAVAESGENPLVHYLRQGWRDGLSPHPLFAGDWYLERHDAARRAGIAPLLHYVTRGAAEGLDPHPLFDQAHYRRQRGALLHGEPIADYLASGARARRSPSPHFQLPFYLEQAAETPAALADPLGHYLTQGAFAGLWPAADFDEAAYFGVHPEAAVGTLSGLEHWRRRPADRTSFASDPAQAVPAAALFADLRRATDPDPEAYDNAAYAALRRKRRRKGRLGGRADDVQVIALRRTQAPDWTRVLRALPNFRGHLQPRAPADGFSDPKDASALRRDVRLAERYGLAAFCHEVGSAAAVRAVTGLKAPAFPYCLAWSGPRAAQPALAALAPALPGALTLDGRPVVLASPDIDPDAWRKAAGPAGLFLVQRGGRPRPGFDARLPDLDVPRAAEGPPAPRANTDFRGAVHDARALIAGRMDAEPDALPLVVCGRDTTPLSQDAPVIWQGASPGAFQAWLEAAIDRARGRPKGQRLVFVHAWNDWETGAALAPDLRFGHGWLEALANAADAELLAPPRPAP
jgi:hypothetical protein